MVPKPEQQQTTSYGSIDVSVEDENHNILPPHYPSTIIGSEEEENLLIDPNIRLNNRHHHNYHRCHSCGKPDGDYCDGDDIMETDDEEGGGGGGGGGSGGKKSNNRNNNNNTEDPITLHLHCRTRSTTFWNDTKNMKEGTIPHSIIVGLCVGIVCGFAVFLYYKALFGLMDWLWKDLPQQLIVEGKWPEHLQVLWIPLVLFVIAIGIGLTVIYIGEPGDLAYTIKCVHEKGYITIDHAVPMVFASLFSIAGGGPIGPEPPLVAICASIGGYISMKFFKQRNRNVVRKHTLMGMGAALAALFGCPLGGPLFALEVNSRFGIEYFEHTVETVFAGCIAVIVMRFLSGDVMESIWEISELKLTEAEPTDVLLGGALGLLGAGITVAFGTFHCRVMDVFDYFGLLDNKYAVRRALLATIFIALLGMLIPHTLFWGELEFEAIATMAPSSALPYAWPTSGLIGFEMDNGWKALVVGITKMISISFGIAGGYRGGVIFPFFAAGAAFGRSFTAVFPAVNIQLATLCFAAGIEVSFLRTVLSTPIILCYLSGEQQAMAGVLAASLVSLFATSYIPFVKTQTVRNDLDSTMFHDSSHRKNLVIEEAQGT